MVHKSGFTISALHTRDHDFKTYSVPIRHNTQSHIVQARSEAFICGFFLPSKPAEFMQITVNQTSRTVAAL